MCHVLPETLTDRLFKVILVNLLFVAGFDPKTYKMLLVVSKFGSMNSRICSLKF